MGTSIAAAWRRFEGDERGSSTVEFVIIFTPFIMLIFLILQVSIAYHWTLSAQKGLEMAARMAAVRPPVAVELIQQTGLGTFPVTRTPQPGFEPGEACVDGACQAIDVAICNGASIAAADPNDTVVDGCSVELFMELYNEIDRFAYDLEVENFAISYTDVSLGNAGQRYIPLITLAVNPEATPVILTFFRGNTATWTEDADGNATATIEQGSGGSTSVQFDVPQILATIVAEDLGI